MCVLLKQLFVGSVQRPRVEFAHLMDSSYDAELQGRVPPDCCMTSSSTFCFNVNQEVVVRNCFQRPFLIGRIPGHNSLHVGHRGGTINSCQEFLVPLTR